MSSTTRLLVLGVVRMFQPVHGYDVRRELVSWHVEEWASIAPGSIYNALKTLSREGLLEIVGTKQVGGRPERTSYRLTVRGEVEMSELLRDHWWTVRMPMDPLIAGLSLMYYMTREEAISALEARIAKIRGSLAHAEYVIAAIDDVETPIHVREMMRLINARAAAEIPWARAFIERLRAGEYRLAGDPNWAPRTVVVAREAEAAAAKTAKRARMLPRKVPAKAPRKPAHKAR